MHCMIANTQQKAKKFTTANCYKEQQEKRGDENDTAKKTQGLMILPSHADSEASFVYLKKQKTHFTGFKQTL